MASLLAGPLKCGRYYTIIPLSTWIREKDAWDKEDKDGKKRTDKFDGHGKNDKEQESSNRGSQDGLEGDQEGKTVQQEKHQDDIHPIAAFHPKIGMVSGGTVWWISTPLFKRLNNLY